MLVKVKFLYLLCKCVVVQDSKIYNVSKVGGQVFVQMLLQSLATVTFETRIPCRYCPNFHIIIPRMNTSRIYTENKMTITVTGNFCQ